LSAKGGGGGQEVKIRGLILTEYSMIITLAFGVSIEPEDEAGRWECRKDTHVF